MIVAFLGAVLLAAAPASTFTLTSPTFADGATMPASTMYKGYGCTGNNEPPEIRWSGAPAGTKSFALTVLDPDAPVPGGWWHWVAFNISAKTNSLDRHAPTRSFVNGTSSFKTRGYGGPCPPPGKPHHYVFTLYALDEASVSNASGDTTGPDLLKAIEGHVLGKAVLTGLFSR